MRYLIAFALSAFFAGATWATAQGAIDIRTIAPTSPVSGTLSLDGASMAGDRIELVLVIDLPSLLPEIDALGQGRGNVGSEETRLYWVGPTNLLGVEDQTAAVLRSRARFELWTSGLVETRLLEDTKDVDLWVRPIWDPATAALRLEYEILNIRNFPGEFEDLLRSFGVAFSGSLPIFSADTETLASLDLRLEPQSTEPSAAGLRLRLLASVDKEVATANLLSGGVPANIAASIGRILLGSGQ